METLLQVVGIAVLVAGSLWWRSRLLHSIRDRAVNTGLAPVVVRRLFVDTVATWSWHIEEDGDELVARSSLLTGIVRQRIALRTSPRGERTIVHVGVTSYEGQFLWSYPQSAYALSWRIEAFLDALLAADPTAREVTP